VEKDSWQHWQKFNKKLEYTHNMTIAQQLKIKEFPFRIKDSNGNEIYWEDSSGYWEKREYDVNGNRIYWENSFGTIVDKRPKTDIQKAIELLTKEGLLVDGKILKN
jgi:hypothetical protein